jgi:hypothetical protein
MRLGIPDALVNVACGVTLSEHATSPRAGRAELTSSKLRLPQPDGGWLLTDGGIETVLIDQDGVELPEFAAFVLLATAEGRDILRRCDRRYLVIRVAALGAMQRFKAEAVALTASDRPRCISGVYRLTNSHRCSGYHVLQQLPATTGSPWNISLDQVAAWRAGTIKSSCGEPRRNGKN